MIRLRKAASRDHHEHESASPWLEKTVDRRIQPVKDVLGMLTDEGGRIFSPAKLDEIAKRIVFWIDEVK